MERFEFLTGLGRRPARRREEEEPMRLLLLGDFSGRPASERAPLRDRPTHRVDLDTFDRVMKRLAPQVSAPSGVIAFETLDDFHPDRLFDRLELFKALRTARATPPAAAANDVGRLLGTAPPRSPAGGTPANPIDALIHQIVAPHIVGEDTSTSYTAAVDAATTEQMRTLLHEPAFQSLEAAWRGAWWLVSNIELGEELQLHLFDVTREELLADIGAAGGDMTRTGLHAALAERAREVAGAPRWSLLVGLFEFGSQASDAGLLAALGLVAANAGAPLVAGAARAMSEEGEMPQDWDALRRSEVARWVALAGPRVLLRLPYGQRTDPIERFGFEEFAGLPEHDAFLWGAASLAIAVLVGRSFAARGWEMELGDEREIGDLPAYTFVRDGEPELQACAERFLSERQLEAMLSRGVIPLASRRDRNAVVAVRFQSIADPPAPIAW